VVVNVVFAIVHRIFFLVRLFDVISVLTSTTPLSASFFSSLYLFVCLAFHPVVQPNREFVPLCAK
jgi:hypothetical protein